MKVVPDNNILARAHPNSRGPARRLLTRITSEPGALVLSRYMLQELQRVMLYTRLLRRSHLTLSEISTYVYELADVATLVVPAQVPTGLLRDTADDPILKRH